MYRRSSESQMRSGTLRGVSKWSRRKDRYIGRLYSDIGKGPSDSGIFQSTKELREYVLGLIGPYGNRGKRPKERRRAAPLWSELDKGCSPLFLVPLPLFPSLLLQQGKEESYSRWEEDSSWRALLADRPPPPGSFIYGGRGGTSRHNTS